ncbi:hypothetical protein [Nocardia brasiliensis]|uniref:hypothetical protein n=1 Tax=Nocardia brasiliensis TaxID=37326 RepID=UPI00142DF600|nr:hypothetical protein [Nocardia brasiliensis]
MASGGPGFDQTEWSGLLRGARDGKLRMVHVDSGRLGELTSACEDFLADVQGFIDASLSVNFSKFSWTHDNKDPADGTPQPKARHVVTTLSSMAMLFEKFERKRTVELVEVLKNHQAIVRVMGDTFVAANKKYVVMDGANANTFVAPERGTDLWPEIFRHYSVPASDWKAGPAFSTKAGSGVSFDVGVKGMVEGVVENGKSFDLIGFANIAEMLGRNSAGVYWLAGQWRALADIWRVSVQKFMDRVGPVFKGQYWEGVGADRAVAFVEKYVQATDTLYSGLLSMSNVVGNTADFNAFVRSHLPLYEHLYFNSDGSVSKVDADNGNDTNAGRHLPRVQTFWDSGDGTSDQKGYVLGIKQLAGLVPVFNDPNKLAGAQGDLPGSFNYRGPSGDGRGGGGTGDGSGGNSGGGSGGGTGGKSGGPTGAEGGGKGDGTGGSTGNGAGVPGGGIGGKPSSGGADPRGSKGMPSAVPGPTTGTPRGESGPLSALSKALQQLGSGLPTGPSGPWAATGPLGAFGPTGASGPFGFDIKPAGASGGGGGSPGVPGKPLEDKLFPRAGGAGGNSTDAVAARAAMAPAAAMPYGGYPMGAPMGGGGAAGQQQQQQQRKRAAYLDSTEHLEEAVGEDPLSVRPIIDR